MKSSRSSPKRSGKNSSEEVTAFDLFYQLTYMSATAAAGLQRGRLFELASRVDTPAAQYFQEINELVDKMRYSSPEACRMVGEHVKSEDLHTFLLRLSDALRSGEPLPPFLAREAEVQGDHYVNAYERDLQSLSKWNDGYTSVSVSVALIVIINMVSTMIYPISQMAMGVMILTAVVIGFALAWVVSRAAPPEVYSIPWKQGSTQQRLSQKLATLFLPITVALTFALAMLHMPMSWLFIVAALPLVPLGISCMIAESRLPRKGAEISAFFRSLGGTATSRGTTLGDALASIKIDSFPALEADIKRLSLRLRAGAKPGSCWRLFGQETGSLLVSQAARVFYEATNLGGDPQVSGVLCSLFASKTALLRAKRGGVAATFTMLTLVMHGVISALMVFILEILRRFTIMLQAAMDTLQSDPATAQQGMSAMAFNIPQMSFLEQLTVGLLIVLALISSYAIVASEGTNILKISFYLFIMLFMNGIAFLIIPALLVNVL